jgi:hypothetical protein
MTAVNRSEATAVAATNPDRGACVIAAPEMTGPTMPPVVYIRMKAAFAVASWLGSTSWPSMASPSM